MTRPRWKVVEGKGLVPLNKEAADQLQKELIAGVSSFVLAEEYGEEEDYSTAQYSVIEEELNYETYLRSLDKPLPPLMFANSSTPAYPIGFLREKG